MNQRKPSPLPSRQPPGAESPSRHRSGAVARMLRMPVATLRVWERRYGLTQPELSPSGQRLYSAADVRRLALVKQLVDVGHAIGSLAPLNMPQLQRVAATHAQALAATQRGGHPAAADKHRLPSEPVPPRRWDDAALADFASLSSTVACECPRHVAELLVQLSRFEAYSAECRQRSAADAELHAHLRQVAAVSRAHFEAALERVALHEGLVLPSSPRPNDTALATTRRPRHRP